MLTRRRFIQISAACTASSLLVTPGRAAAPVTRWTGTAMGAKTSITLAHPDEADAQRIVAAARAEIARLERTFSLYRADSTISRLNLEGHLAHPPFDFLSLLSLVDGLNDATQGAFDPTIQPLWRLYARHFADPATMGDTPDPKMIQAARDRIGWKSVIADSAQVRFAGPGMNLTLNGIAQGYATDRVADLLRAEGLSNVLVDVGEIRALGRHPDGRPWRAGLAARGNAEVEERIEIAEAALATTAPLGTVLDTAGEVPHLIDPRTGEPGGRWRRVSVLGPSAAVADGLSTGFALMDRHAIGRALRRYPGYHVIAVDDKLGRLDLSA